MGHEASNTEACGIAPVGRYVADGSTATIEVPEGFRAISCVASDEGEESNQGCQDNEVCIAGKYGTVPPTGACESCPVGFYSSLGWTKCRRCSPGSYSSSEASPVCALCPLGFIMKEEGAQFCSQCPIGKSTSQTGSRSCEMLLDDTVSPPELISLRPVDIKQSGLVLSISNNIPKDVTLLLLQWSTLKEFRNTSGDMRQLILSVSTMSESGGAVHDILFNASRPGSVWRSKVYLRTAWLLSNGRQGRFSRDINYFRVAADCREKQGIKHYLRTHPSDNICAPPLNLLTSEPTCEACPEGGSCNSPGTDLEPGAPGILVWNIAALRGYWRVPWTPSNNTPMFYRCPRPLACLGVSVDDTFNSTSGWTIKEENDDEENSTSTTVCPPPPRQSRCRNGTTGPLCAVCAQGYNRVQGSCEKCIPVANRVAYVIVALIFFGVAGFFIIRLVRRTRAEVRYALRDANRILLICLSLSQINVTVPQVIDIKWPQNVLDFLDLFDWVNIDFTALTGATCEASVDFRFTFVCMALVPVLVLSVALSSYLRGARLIRLRIHHLRDASDDEKRHALLTCYVEIFRVVDCDHSGEISPEEFVDLLKLVGYDNKKGTLTIPVAQRAIQRITGSVFATSLSMERFVSGMECGKIVEVADDLLGKRKRRRSSGSRLLDKEAADGWKKKSTQVIDDVVLKKRSSVFGLGSRGNLKKKRGSTNILHNDTFALLVWNQHRKLVAESFSWAMQLLMLMHTPISRKVFQYLDCHEIGHGKHTQSFVRADYSIPCMKLGGTLDDSYTAFLPLVVLVLCGFTLMLPFGVITFLIMKRNDLYSPDVLARIGWLYNRLNRGVEFWEVHEMLRKMLLTGIVVFFPRDQSVKATLALSICICAQVSLSLWRPHRSKTVFITAQFAYAMALVMYLMATMLAFAELTDSQRNTIGYFIVVLQSSFVAFGVAAIAVSLITLRSRFKGKRRSITVGAHVAEVLKKGASKEKRRSSLTNMVNRLASVAYKVVDNHEALAIMKRHSMTLKSRLHTINILKKKSSKKVEARLKKRATMMALRSNSGLTAPVGESERSEKENGNFNDLKQKMKKNLDRREDDIHYFDEIQQVRKMMQDKCGNEQKLARIFTKVDIDHNASLSETEFKNFVNRLFKSFGTDAMSEDVLDAVFSSAMLKTSQSDELDTESLKKWVFGDVCGITKLRRIESRNKKARKTSFGITVVGQELENLS